MAGSMGYRQQVGYSSALHMRKFIAAMKTIQGITDNRGFHHIAGFHGAPGGYCWHHQSSRRSSLQARLFLPWHRAYLYHLERALKDVDPEVMLPYWDWTEGNGLPEAYERPTIEDQPNPLRSFRIDLTPPQVSTPIQRNTNRDPDPSMPVFTQTWARPGDTNQDGIATLAELSSYVVNEITDFESFNDMIEIVHDHLHNYVGGDMGSVTTAAFDPIFYAHHCMIDRLWYLWQLRNGVDNFPQALTSITLAPFNLTVGETLNVQELGYEYALEVTPVNPDPDEEPPTE